MTASLLRLADSRGCDSTALVRGLGKSLDELMEPRGHLDWNLYCALCDRLASEFGDQGLIDLGREFNASPWARPFTVVSVLLRSPIAIYRWALRPEVVKNFIRCLTLSAEVVESNRLSIRARLDPGYAPSRAHFLVLQGTFVEIPRLLGLPAAEVKMSEVEGGVDYSVRFADTPGLIGRARYWLARWPQMLLGRMAAHDVLIRQLAELEDEIGARRHAEAELRRHRADLERTVEERTRELLASEEKLQQSERLSALGTFAAGIAHQINNPVASILASSQYALLCSEEPSEREVWRLALGNVEKEALRCASIVKGILLFARGQSGAGESLDLNILVEEVVDTMRSYAAERSVALLFEPDPTPVGVSGSKLEIEQALSNVVANALEAGGKRVKVGTRLTGDLAEIDVSDDGCGMSEEVRSKLFHPFFTTRLGRGGTGLGLSVAHGLVHSQGGSIEIQSKLDCGTQVKILLPRNGPRSPDTGDRQ